MPHPAGALALHAQRLGADCERYVASRQFEARGARCRYRLHSGRARNRTLKLIVVAGVLPAVQAGRAFDSAAEDGCLHRRDIPVERRGKLFTLSG